MKKLLLIMLLSLVSVCSYSQKISNADFVYPIKPGDGKWKKMNSVAERIATLQIPENILSKIPTERLLDICLDYPYLLDLSAGLHHADCNGNSEVEFRGS